MEEFLWPANIPMAPVFVQHCSDGEKVHTEPGGLFESWTEWQGASTLLGCPSITRTLLNLMMVNSSLVLNQYVCTTITGIVFLPDPMNVI